MLLEAIEKALSLTSRMHELALARDWFGLFDVEQARGAILQQFSVLERDAASRNEYEPLLRELHARNEEVRILCEQARGQLRNAMQTANRAHAASLAYTAV